MRQKATRRQLLRTAETLLGCANDRRLTMRTFAEKPKAMQPTKSAKSSSVTRASVGQRHDPNSILLLLKSTIGNQAVLKLLQSNAEERNALLTGTTSPHLGYDFARIPGSSPKAGASQTKLAINKPGVDYEQEADRVTEQVMRKPEWRLQPPYELPQTKRDQASDVGQTAVPPAVYEGLQSPGHPLDPGTRAFIEPRFGRNFSDVRLHTGSEANKGASAVSARAYTIGNDIVLGMGEHSPQTAEGRHLLAHELTHVLQQRAGARPANGMSAPGDAFERQADAVADAIAGGHSAGPMLDSLGPVAEAARSEPSVMRQTEPKPNPAEYEFVPIAKGGTWDAVAILERISQREYTQTRISKSQPAEGTESDPYRCGQSAVLATAIVAGPKAVMALCVNLYKRILEWRELAKKDDEAFREKQRAARRAGTDPDAVKKEVPFYDVSDRAAKTVFDIHWNLETGIRFGTHEGGGCTLTYADLDRLSNYLYMFTFDAKNEWRRDAEVAAKATSPDNLKPEVRSRLEPLFEKQKNAREEERRENPNIGELTWSRFVRKLNYRARFRTEVEISDAAAMAGYDAKKEMINTLEVTEKLVLDWRLDRLKPGESLIGMWGPHTYTFFCAQDKKIYLYDSWRSAIDEKAAVPTFNAADSVHERGSAEYEDRIQKGLTGKDKPIKLLLGAAHTMSFY